MFVGGHSCSRAFKTHLLCTCAPRDADETKEWIEEKNQALNTDNYGHDLASVQALQRKHEGFERDLAALGDKVRAVSEALRRSEAVAHRASSVLRSTLWGRRQSA